jgi:hypothetical protein
MHANLVETMVRLMTDETKRRASALTWIGFAVGSACALGWYADRTRFAKQLAQAQLELAEARAELARAAAVPAPRAAEPAVRIDHATDDGPEPAKNGELATARAELSSARAALNATKQALSDSDDTRIEVGQKLKACEASLNQLQAAAK